MKISKAQSKHQLKTQAPLSSKKNLKLLITGGQANILWLLRAL
jgi:hypothetical protein